MIRCVRIWTGDDRNSHFEEGVIDLEPGQRGDVLSGRMPTTTIFGPTNSISTRLSKRSASKRRLPRTMSCSMRAEMS